MVDWKPLKPSLHTGRNRWGWDQSKQLLCANLVAARLGGLPPTGILTQRGADLLEAPLRFGCLNKPSPATRPLGPWWKTRRLLLHLAFSLAGSLLPLLNRGSTARVAASRLVEVKQACSRLLATELL